MEFPHEGSWTIAFLTGTPAPAVAAHLAEEHVSVYVPTTPNPTSGYFIIVPRSRVRELDMTVDEALKYVISMGVVSPRAHGIAATVAGVAAVAARRARANPPPPIPEIDRAATRQRLASGPARGALPRPPRL